MAHSAALRPFGFSRPTVKPGRRVDTPIPSEESDYPVRASRAPTYHPPKSRRVQSPTDDSFGSYWETPAHHLPRSAAMRSEYSQRTFPDEEEDDTMRSSRPSRTHEKPRPTRLRTSRHAKSQSISSPLTPTTIKMLSEMQLRPASSGGREDVTEKQLEQQLKDVYAALRRVEAEREKVAGLVEAGRADRHRMERELEATRRENQRLAARLEEMLRLRSPSRRSPVGSRSDDAWGCSMYDMEGEGR